MTSTMCDTAVVSSALSLGNTVRNLSSCTLESQFNKTDEIRGDDSCLQGSSLQVKTCSGETGSPGFSNKSDGAYIYRFQLQQDVERLEQQLQEEMKVHAILENVIEQNAVKLTSSSYLPHHAQDLLSSIAILEFTVSKLEQELVTLHFQLSQERNERRLAEYRWRQSSSQSLFVCSDMMKEPILPCLRSSKRSMSELSHSSEENSFHELRYDGAEATSKSSSTCRNIENAVDRFVPTNEEKTSIKLDTECRQPVDSGKLTREVQPKVLWDHPNQLSEEMVRCMKNIFISLADSTLPSQSSASESHCLSSSPRGQLSNSSLWSFSESSISSSWVRSPQVDVQCDPAVLATENTFEPYRVRGKLSWANIGSYGLATEVSWMSVGKKQLEYAAGALRGFRTLVEQLAKLNPVHMSGNEKLAFWINLYNALIMHAYLAYGVPRSDLKQFSLMQKAAYTVGGHSYSATAIEYVILKMKPPVHRPQIALLLALHKLKVSEEQRKSSIDTFEPLVAFALSCGMYSSPAVRIYTAKNVREELEEAQVDYIRASVGVSSKGKLLVPKMLHCFAKGFVDDSELAVWISHYLPGNQAAFVEQCISKRRQSLLGSRNCGILSFDSRFRYLFLPEKVSL